MSRSRSGSRSRALVGVTLLVLVLALWGCEAGRPTAPADRSGVVRAALSADPSSLSLIGKTDRNAARIAAQITDGLVRYDPQMRLVPRVAESWEFSADRRSLIFVLREGVRWHDGTPVTADDVVFTVRKVLDPATENRSYAPQLREVEDVTALGPRTVRVSYERASAGALEAWQVPLIPRHAAADDEDLLTGSFASHPVGCGPFRFVSYRPGQELVLEANGDYWDGRPTIDGLVFRIYPDRRTAYHALLRGELDILGVPAAQWRDPRGSAAAARLDSFVYSTLSVWPVVWNQDGSNPFFTDPRVRQAMTHALDRETFIETVAYGLARPGTTTFHPDTPWADPAVLPRPFDRARAERLLDEAGWTDSDGDGTRDRDGRPFRFTLLIPHSTVELTRQIAAWQQDAWSEIGIETEIEQLEWQAFRELRNAGQFEAASFSMSFSPEPEQFFDLYHSSASDSGFNFYGFADPGVDRLLETARKTFDDDERVRIYRELQRLIFDLEPISCTFFFAQPVLHDRRLRGVVPSPIDHWRTTAGPRVWYWADPAG